MRTRLGIVAAAMLGAVGQSQGQITPGSVEYTLEYERVSASGAVLGGGALQPEEWISLRLRFHYVPGYGTPVTWPSSMLVGSSGAGTIEGFWSGNLTVSVSGSAAGQWSNTTAGSLPVRRQLVVPFNAASSSSGTPSASGTLLSNLTPNQFHGQINMVNSSNDAVIWRGAWKPLIYEQGTLTFALLQGSLGRLTYLVARDSNPEFELPVAGSVPATYGSVVVPMVPSPSGAVLLVFGGLAGARRRRAVHGGES
jgi:hypothetical protein